MTVNKKDICPECGVNEKGVRAKTCRPCAVKALSTINRKAEENNDLLTKAAQAVNTAEEVITAQSMSALQHAENVLVGIELAHQVAGDSDGLFGPGAQPELMGVDLAKPGAERTVITTKQPGKDPTYEEVKQRPPRVGETTEDGKFYK